MLRDRSADEQGGRFDSSIRGSITVGNLPKSLRNRLAFERFVVFGLCIGQKAMTSTKADHDSLPTRWSLLARLKNWEDQESWKTFFDTYWRLIYNVAIKAGLTDQEARRGAGNRHCRREESEGVQN